MHSLINFHRSGVRRNVNACSMVQLRNIQSKEIVTEIDGIVFLNMLIQSNNSIPCVGNSSF